MEEIARTRRIRQDRGDQPSGAGFRGGKRQLRLAEALEQARGALHQRRIDLRDFDFFRHAQRDPICFSAAA